MIPTFTPIGYETFEVGVIAKDPCHEPTPIVFRLGSKYTEAQWHNVEVGVVSG